jgi:hypothetical protein
MEKERIIEVINNVEDKSNKDLFEVINILYQEHEKTKKLIFNLTKHMDGIEESYKKVEKEVNKRIKK